MRRRAAGTPTVAQAGTVRLDTVAVRATVRGRDLPLSVKEFSLLRFLIQGSPEPRSRTAVLEEVWGSAEHFDPTAAADADVAIRTVRGVGYALDVHHP
ncbi:winged helix-turn-helix domain-containing protein [Curtobacterium sp. Csp1]|uniref:winged helix-turn-helix domain-containing protein n=1 Tax=Curtobacterium sp. Csp1 TaxID=2495429 RepID=UPI0020C61A70|nr:winged helix-turn-helix domain-containing protein [Curtobacterium sp. Csp1]